jgi:hypothetical protein
VAEREGFEPPIPVKVCLISSQVHSTGLCHLSARHQPFRVYWQSDRGCNGAARLLKGEEAELLFSVCGFAEEIWRGLKPRASLAHLQAPQRFNQRVILRRPTAASLCLNVNVDNNAPVPGLGGIGRNRQSITGFALRLPLCAVNSHNLPRREQRERRAMPGAGVKSQDIFAAGELLAN